MFEILFTGKYNRLFISIFFFNEIHRLIVYIFSWNCEKLIIEDKDISIEDTRGVTCE